GQFIKPQGIAVDQATHNVYVLDSDRQTNVVQVFSPDGKELITSFGQRGEEKPEQIQSPRKNGIAVDTSGNVFIVDGANGQIGNERVMIFRPKPGSSYKEYEYVHGSDLAVGFTSTHVAVDDANNIYISNHQDIYKFTVGDPTPIWKFERKCEIEGMAVNPVDGEVFLYCSQNKTFYRLNSGGTLEEEFPGVAKETGTEGLAFDPGFAWSL